MFLIRLLTYLFISMIYKYQEKLGNDERKPLSDEKTLLPKIIENYEKKKLLDYLKLDNITDFNKIKKIYDFYGNNLNNMNLLNGGLFNDWNF